MTKFGSSFLIALSIYLLSFSYDSIATNYMYSPSSSGSQQQQQQLIRPFMKYNNYWLFKIPITGNRTPVFRLVSDTGDNQGKGRTSETYPSQSRNGYSSSIGYIPPLPIGGGYQNKGVTTLNKGQTLSNKGQTTSTKAQIPSNRAQIPSNKGQIPSNKGQTSFTKGNSAHTNNAYAPAPSTSPMITKGNYNQQPSTKGQPSPSTKGIPVQPSPDNGGNLQSDTRGIEEEIINLEPEYNGDGRSSRRGRDTETKDPYPEYGTDYVTSRPLGDFLDFAHEIQQHKGH